MTAFIFGIISIIFASVIGAVGGLFLALAVLDEIYEEKKVEWNCDCDECDPEQCRCACHKNTCCKGPCKTESANT